MTPLLLTAAILSPGLLIVAVIFVMVVVDAIAAVRPRPKHVGRHRARVIEGELVDTFPIPVGGVS